VTITWRLRALRDLQEIQAFVAAGSSAAQGYETLVALHEQINDLLLNPQRGRIDSRRPGTRFFIAPIGGHTYGLPCAVPPPRRAHLHHPGARYASERFVRCYHLPQAWHRIRSASTP